MIEWAVSNSGSSPPRMPERSLAIGAAGGSFASLLLGFTKDLISQGGGIHAVVPEVANCFCGALDLDCPGFHIFAAGVLVGILLGPIVDLIWILRQRRRRCILLQTNPPAASSRALYKVI